MRSITTANGRRRARKAATLGLAAGLALALTACGDDGDGGDAATDGTEAGGGGGYGDGATTTTTEAAGGQTVAYEVSAVEYTDVTAPAGGTLEIENTSAVPHTFTADGGEFDVAYEADETATVEVPGEPGEYPFHCEIHSSMEATLTVE